MDKNSRTLSMFGNSFEMFLVLTEAFPDTCALLITGAFPVFCARSSWHFSEHTDMWELFEIQVVVQ